jgi:hypothetical protein
LREFDRIKGALERFIREVMSGVDYHALYPAKVVSQSGQTVDVFTDDPRFGSITGVPIRTFAPSVEIVVAPNARVAIGFEAGDPEKPYAAWWEAGSLTSIAIAGDTDAAALAAKIDATINAFVNATPVAQDGGLAIHTAMKNEWTLNQGGTCASTKLLLGS